MPKRNRSSAPAAVKAAPSLASTNGNRRKLWDVGVRNCHFSHSSIRRCHAAHIFPACWIETARLSRRLSGRGLRNTDLAAVGNFLLLTPSIHDMWDHALFGLEPQAAAGTYTVRHAVGGEHDGLAFLAHNGVTNGRVIAIPHANRALMQWRWEQYRDGRPLKAAGEGSESSGFEPPKPSPTAEEAAAMLKAKMEMFFKDLQPRGSRCDQTRKSAKP